MPEPTTLSNATPTELVGELIARLSFPTQAKSIPFSMLRSLARETLRVIANRLE